MTWFKVDDKFHSHNKTRKVLAEAPSALALWVVAGSWSSDNLTDGLIPDHQLPWLIPTGAEEMARTLVTARLWRRVRGGYQFHEWTSDGDGSKRNPTREEVENERRKKAEAGRKGGLASGKTRSKPEARASADASAPANGVVEPPTRPDPKGRGGTGRSHRGTSVTRASPEPPPPKCEEHLDTPDPPPCGPCADARRRRETWDREQLLAAAEEQSRQARDRAVATAQAIAACQLCDASGYRNGRLCNHDPDQADRARTGAAAVREALGRPVLEGP